MTTILTGYEVEIDQECPVTLTFELEAEGSPELGWEVTVAILTESVVWLDDDQAEESQSLCVNKTQWFNRYLDELACRRDSLERQLSEQYERDHEDDDLFASPSWRVAVFAGVD